MNVTKDGLLSTVKGTIYIVPANKTATISSIHVSNLSGSARTATIYAKNKGVSRPISANNMALAADAVAISETVIRLTAGYVLEGIASGSDVHYLVTIDEV